jgi:hypothetical protein
MMRGWKHSTLKNEAMHKKEKKLVMGSEEFEEQQFISTRHKATQAWMPVLGERNVKRHKA